MKLTEDRIKKIILEELNELAAEAEPAADKPAEKSSYTSSDLKQELIMLGQKIQSVKGLDANELKLISGIIGTVVDLASKKSGATALKRIYDMLEKFNEK